VDGDQGGGDALTGADLAGRDGVQRRLEADQAVLAAPAQVPVGDQVGRGRKRAQRRPVSLGADPDDLAVGAVGLRPPDRHPVVERRVELGCPLRA